MAQKKSAEVKPLSGSNYVILLSLAALIGLGVTALVSKSLIKSISTQTYILSAKRTANKNLDANLIAAPKLVNSYEELDSTTRGRISNSLPTTTDFPNLIAQLENMSRSTGVTLVSVSRSTSVAADSAPAATAGTVSPKPFPISLTVTGTFATVQQFIAATERSARPLKVTSMQLAGSSSAITAQIEATTYSQDAATIPFKLEELKK